MVSIGKILQILSDETVSRSGEFAVDVLLHHLTADSRTVRPSSVFVAVAGGTTDGHRFIPNAVERGAALVVGSQPPSSLADLPALLKKAPYLQVKNSRAALALCAASLHDFPSHALTVIGVTGTDGKTTTSSLLEAILTATTRSKEYPAGRVGVITTVGARIGGQDSDTGLHVTTPDAPEVQRFLAEMRAASCEYAVVESTSHGLDQGRVDAVAFDVAAVTNITHEHLDYHRARPAYVAAKAKLFRKLYEPSPKAALPTAVLNADDEGSYAALLAALGEEAERGGSQVRILSYGLAGRNLPANDFPAADVTASEIVYSPAATHFKVNWQGKSFPLESRLIGEFNVYNVLCACTVALSLGIAPAVIQTGVGEFQGVLGRMQRMDCGQPFLAVVDFAHTPVSLERALATLRPLVGSHPDGAPGRLIAVFGSAGLRDRAKRRLMGQVSGRLADFTVVTAEDPRTEDVHNICREIAEGVRQFVNEDRFVVIPDRSQAILAAVKMAQPGDIVAAFGKGHERSMCYGEIEYPWSDQQAMIDALTSDG